MYFIYFGLMEKFHFNWKRGHGRTINRSNMKTLQASGRGSEKLFHNVCISSGHSLGPLALGLATFQHLNYYNLGIS